MTERVNLDAPAGPIMPEWMKVGATVVVVESRLREVPTTESVTVKSIGKRDIVLQTKNDTFRFRHADYCPTDRASSRSRKADFYQRYVNSGSFHGYTAEMFAPDNPCLQAVVAESELHQAKRAVNFYAKKWDGSPDATQKLMDALRQHTFRRDRMEGLTKKEDS